MSKISRRELAKLAAGVAVARALPVSAQAPAGPAYIGPLTGVEKGIEDRKFDPVAYTASLLCIVTACAGAALIPALRAVRSDPVAALRQD